jgi:hypothetical protein
LNKRIVRKYNTVKRKQPKIMSFQYEILYSMWW